MALTLVIAGMRMLLPAVWATSVRSATGVLPLGQQRTVRITTGPDERP
ncbi:MAG TPA: hypothetical protein VLA19_16885 [Herpetosiphonaceae bacterium]|nr:hypothetical protein [Herpetosiphonaceae bacterium]